MRRLFFLRRQTPNLMLILMLAITFFGVNTSSAQSDLQVFTYSKKTPIKQVPIDSSYEVIRVEGKWKYIRFNQPSIPIWLSSEFLDIDQDTNVATVATSIMNARLFASNSSSVLGQIYRGYKAKVLELNNDFTKVLAPSYFSYAIELEQDSIPRTKATQNISDTNDSTAWMINEKTKPSEAVLVPNAINDSKAISEYEIVDDSFDQRLNAETTTQTPGVNAKYRLAVGDSISVQVFGEADLSLPTTTVPQSGVISFPLIGSIEIVGKTTQEIEASLVSALSLGYIKNPTLTVAITGYRPIFVRGAVVSSGSFTYTEGLTLAQALLLAGGTKNTAKPFGAGIDRDGRVFQQNLSLNSNVAVSPGDVLTVEENVGFSEEGQLLYVYLHGEVNKPGEYQYRPGLTVEKAIVLAGGFGLRASKRKVSVSRYIEGQQAPEIMKKVKLYLPVQPGDIINVGASWF